MWQQPAVRLEFSIASVDTCSNRGEYAMLCTTCHFCHVPYIYVHRTKYVYRPNTSIQRDNGNTRISLYVHSVHTLDT